jgi:cell division protein FtsI/penicillin-binding protein 2
VTARSRERGSHAGRARGYVLPFPDHHGLNTQAPVRPGNGASGNSGNSVSGSPVAGAVRVGSRHRKKQERKPRLSGKAKLAAILVVVIAALSVGFTDGFGSDASAEPTVQAFLLDWQQGKYAQAAALTDGDKGKVADELTAAYTDLDATNAFFAMGHVQQHGDTAVAEYKSTVDLAQPGQQWVYTGQFQLTQRGGHWVVNWAPDVINPRLAAGDRLAVVTTFPPRAQIENSDGGSLLAKSAGYHIGVYPGRLRNAAATAARFSQLTGLNKQQMLGQIQAAPPGEFLSLLTLEHGSFSKLWAKAAKVPGLSYKRQPERLAGSFAPEVVGDVGTETSPILTAEGAAYQPGTTVGLAGLEQTYQDELSGTPTTSVVVVNSAGRSVATLWNSPGHPGTPVQTTLSSKDQAAAETALAAQPGSGEIVAVDSRSGAIRVLASRDSAGPSLPSGGPLNGKVAPGMAFSIVSGAALLSAGVPENQPMPCEPVTTDGGVTFAYQPITSATATFASDFATGCGTAFATMSQTLSPSQLTAAERAFGIGGSWRLRVPAFSGSASVASGKADVAAQATGQSGVLMSPLGMAMVAAEVASGVGRAPFLVADDSQATWQAPLSTTALGELRQLMRMAVADGSARAANVSAAKVSGARASDAQASGAKVYGQAGVVKTGAHAYLSWFVGYRGDLAVAAIETGTTASQAAAAALAGAFMKTAG